jgi:hypothetical protein
MKLYDYCLLIELNHAHWRTLRPPKEEMKLASPPFGTMDWILILFYLAYSIF